jgi:hypothetical protein
MPSDNHRVTKDTRERYLWAVFQAALLTGFIQTLLAHTPLYPYRRVAFSVAFIAFAALIANASVRSVRKRLKR